MSLVHKMNISIPCAENVVPANGENAFTSYIIHVELPSRTIRVRRRYREFVSLHEALQQLSHNNINVNLPPKSWWFQSTLNNAEFREQRREALERYLRAIVASGGPTLTSTVWRNFVNLDASLDTPLNSLNTYVKKPDDFGDHHVDRDSHVDFHDTLLEVSSNISVSGLPIDISTDAKSLVFTPITTSIQWLDESKRLTSLLRQTRNYLHKRNALMTRSTNYTTDEAKTRKMAMYDAHYSAKRNLDHATKLLNHLSSTLTNPSTAQWFGAGEAHRRSDILLTARSELDTLHRELDSLFTSTTNDGDFTNSSHQANSALNHHTGALRRQRTLGASAVPETADTRLYNNPELVTRAQSILSSQENSAHELTQQIRRLKNLGTRIHDELNSQTDLLDSNAVHTSHLHSKMCQAARKTRDIR